MRDSNFTPIRFLFIIDVAREFYVGSGWFDLIRNRNVKLLMMLTGNNICGFITENNNVL